MGRVRLRSWRAGLFLLVFFLVSLSLVFGENSAPIILSKYPYGLINEQPVIMRATTDKATLCRYDGSSVSFEEMHFSFEGNATEHNVTLSLLDGQYTYFVVCSDGENVSGVENISFTVDVTSPVIVVNAPSGTLLQKNAELNVTTNEDAVCRFDITDVVYDNLANQFQTTGWKSHRHALTSLPEGPFSYYVRCKDAAGNKNSVAGRIQFSVNLRPTASIAIEGGDTLKSGTYTVKMATSEDLSDAPSLRYSFNDDANLRTVSLVGQGTSFSGYIIIPEEQGNKIGTFSFTGIDMTGLSGSEITSGKLFIVDTKKPPSPLTLEVKNNRNDILLSWYYDGEEVQYFKVYRSDSAGVTFGEYYAKETEEEFRDQDVEEGTTYYYRISAVDEAGNEGELSPERFISAKYVAKNETVRQQSLSISLSGAVKKKMQDVEKSILDIDGAILSLSMSSDSEEIMAIEYFGFLSQAKDTKKSLEELKSQLEGLLLLELSADDLQRRLDVFDLSVNKQVQSVVKDVQVVQKSELLQPAEEASVFTAIDELLKGKTVSGEKKSEYEQAMVVLNEQARIHATIVTVKVKYLDSDREDTFNIIKKSITGEGNAGSVVELVPKTIAERSSQVKARGSPAVLNDDPVLQWYFSSMKNMEIMYHVEGEKDVNMLKTTRTVVLEELPVDVVKNESQGNNSITGLVPGDGVVIRDTQGGFRFDTQTVLLFLGVVCIIGLAVYYFFFLKVEEHEEVKETGEGSLLVAENIHERGSIPSQGGSREVKKLVVQANQFLEELEIEKAYAYYVTAVDLFSRVGGLPEQGVELEGVYEKLRLLQDIKRGHRAVDQGDKMKVKEILTKIDHHVEWNAEKMTNFNRYLLKNKEYFEVFLGKRKIS